MHPSGLRIALARRGVDAGLDVAFQPSLEILPQAQLRPFRPAQSSLPRPAGPGARAGQLQARRKPPGRSAPTPKQRPTPRMEGPPLLATVLASREGRYST